MKNIWAYSLQQSARDLGRLVWTLFRWLIDFIKLLFQGKIWCFAFLCFRGFSPKQSLLTKHVRSSSCLEVSKLQIFMSKQLCQSKGEAITLLQLICWLADISPWKQRLETYEPDNAKNWSGHKNLKVRLWERCSVHETGCSSQLVLVPRRHQAGNGKNFESFYSGWQARADLHIC